MADEAKNKLQIGGLAGWAIAAVQRNRQNAAARRDERELRVVETLSLGGRRQVALVSCGEQKFLVGMGPDTVDSIVPVPNEARIINGRANWGAGF